MDLLAFQTGCPSSRHSSGRSIGRQARMGWICVMAGACLAACRSESGSSDQVTPNATATARDLAVPRSATSPATVRFVLFDDEGDPADVRLLFRPQASASPRPITLAPTSLPLAGVPTHTGAPYEVQWDFAADFGDESYREGIDVELELTDGTQLTAVTDIRVGNDAPDLAAFTVPAPRGLEYVGVIQADFTVSDSAGDVLKLRVEYNADSNAGFPAGSWKRARPIGIDESDPTPEYAIEGLASTSGGVSGTFSWDSEFDLQGKEIDVLLRATPVDDFSAGSPIQAAHPLPIDNNRVPRILIEDSALALHPDVRRAVPIPIRLFDEESDDLRVLVQWAREGEPFAPLPATREGLIALLDDVDRRADRAEMRVATEATRSFEGRVTPLRHSTPAEIRLPELATTAAPLLPRGIQGQRLDILRSSQTPVPVVWGTNPLRRPAGAMALDGGRSALVLDEDGISTLWRVQQLDLASGEVLRTFAQGSGAPRGLAMDQAGSHVFVASDTAVARFAFPSGTPSGSIDHPIALGPRGLAALGSELCVATGDDALLRFDFSPGSSTPLAKLMTGLRKPWGVAADPLHPNVVYIAERSRDRVIRVHLNERIPTAVPATVAQDDIPSLGVVPFPNPRSLALDRSGTRLLVMTEPADGSASLRMLRVNSPRSETTPANVADPIVVELSNGLGDPLALISTGEENVRVAVLTGSDTLGVGGGVLESREIDTAIDAYDPTRQTVRVRQEFHSPPGPGVLWRIRSKRHKYPSSPAGSHTSFLWDTSDVSGGGDVRVRAVCFDGDVGLWHTSAATKRTATDIDVSPTRLATPGFVPGHFAIGDLDGDGDLDLVTTERTGSQLRIYFQTSPAALHAQSACTSRGR